jgi:regulator of RNase E activity RraA
MKKRNVVALVTDGVLRDRAGVLASGLPVWCSGMAAPASISDISGRPRHRVT